MHPLRALSLLALPLSLAAALTGCGGAKDPAVDDGGVAEGDGGLTEDTDGDGHTTDDCSEGDAGVHPGADELCDGVDNDCDGEVDEGVLDTFFLDEDEDGFGGAAAVEACTAPAGSTPTATDCDDADATAYPGATEVCDGVDNNCDGALDEGLAVDWFADADADGFGDPGEVLASCAPPPAGYVENDADCDDDNDDIHPDATEVCDSVDNDCDGEADDGVGRVWYQDADEDGYGLDGVTLTACVAPTGWAALAGDCDDLRAEVSPEDAEACNGRDDDCDGDIDEEGATGGGVWYADLDRDTYGDPAAPQPACAQPAGTVANTLDCDDATASISPAASERCNGDDDDCDGLTDEADAVDAPTWSPDADRDTYGAPTGGVRACAAPAGTVANATDCDDGAAAINPGATERCNGVDDDCDAVIDLDATDLGTWYADLDRDGWGSSATVRSCAAPAGYVGLTGDCDDSTSAVSPAAAEACNSRDDDCDGLTDEAGATGERTYYLDADADLYGDPAAPRAACDRPVGYVTDDSDCEPGVSAAFPGSTAPEVPLDGVDQNCDGDDSCRDLDCDGLPDIIVPEHYDGNYVTTSYIYYGDGGWADADRSSFNTAGVYEALVEDIDEDGYLDVVFANYRDDSSYSKTLDVYWGSASGHSALDRTSLPSSGGLDALVQDLDGDGYKDLVVANYYTGASYSNTSYVYWGSAAGFSTSDREDIPTTGALRVRAADLNDDGYDELVFCSHYTGSSYSANSMIYWGSSRGYTTADRTLLPTLGCYEVEIDDLDGNGIEDIVFANYYTGSTHITSSYVYWGTATGYSTAARESLTTYGAVDLAIGDANGDGFKDLLFSGYHTGDWSSAAYTMLYWGSSFGYTPTNYAAFELRGTWGVKMRDLNSDGYQELLLGRYYNGSSYLTNNVVLWGGATGYSLSNRTDLPGQGNAHLVAGDLDADGIPEMLLANYHTGSWSSPARSWIYWGQVGTPAYTTADRTVLSTHGTWRELTIAGDVGW